MEVKVKGFEDYTVDEFGVIRSYKKDKLPLKTFVNNRGTLDIQITNFNKKKLQIIEIMKRNK